MSPLVWNLAFDALLALFDDSSTHMRGFADDACLIITGQDLPSMFDLMQKAMNQAASWGIQCGLKFSSTKTVAILFTNKLKYKITPPLKMSGKPVQLSDHTKYLGVTLDSKLNWSCHIKDKISQAKKLLMILHSSLGAQWGPRPELMKWAYTSIIRTRLTYGSIVWAKACQDKYCDKFNKLQRLAMLKFGHLRQSTPTAGLEIINDLIPLQLFLKGAAFSTYLRIKHTAPYDWPGTSKGQKVGHLKWLRDLYKPMRIPEWECDDIPPEVNWTNKFNIIQESFQTGEDTPNDNLRCYTDGSKIKSDRSENTGTGYAIFLPTETLQLPLKCEGKSMHPGNSVFQAEITGIDWASQEVQSLLQEGNPDIPKTLTIFSDSQSSIQALDNPVTTSITVKRCKETLNNLASKMDINIRWIKAHVGHHGNEWADKMAKEGASMITDTNNPEIPLPKSFFKQKIKQALYKEWQMLWDRRQDCRQTKIFFPSPNSKKSKLLLQNNRIIYSRTVRYLSGHNFLRRHENLINPCISKLCRLCQNEEETSWHIIGACDALANIRADIFQQHWMDDPPSWDVEQLTKFLQQTPIRDLEEETESTS